jgi:hypothetical protein
VERVREIMRCNLEVFPIKYLGLQLALRPLTKDQWQPMLDQAINFLPAWQRGMIARAGRLNPIKSVIAAKPIHHLLVAEAPVWLLEELEKWQRAFFWAAEREVNGGQCLVSWEMICQPKCYGGLGVENLRLQGLALRVRWEWLRRTDTTKPWTNLPMIRDAEAQDLFFRLARGVVGNGRTILFWMDRWVNGRRVVEIAPKVVAAVSTRCRNRRLVADALQEDSWMLDVQGELSVVGYRQWIDLWIAIRATRIGDNEEGSFCVVLCSFREIYCKGNLQLPLQGRGAMGGCQANLEIKGTAEV